MSTRKEKPMSVKYEEAKKIFLVNLANKNNLYLGNAPDTFLKVRWSGQVI